MMIPIHERLTLKRHPLALRFWQRTGAPLAKLLGNEEACCDITEMSQPLVNYLVREFGAVNACIECLRKLTEVNE